MSSNNVVIKYAKSLFEVTYANSKAGEVGKELQEIQNALSTSELQFFGNPFIATDVKQNTFKTAIEGKCLPETYNFILTLIQNDRIGLIKEIVKEFSTLVQASAGITKGKLISAQEVSPEFIKQVEQKVSASLNKKVELVFEKNQEVLAGYKIEVAGWTIDDSAKAHLNILKDELMKRG